MGVENNMLEFLFGKKDDEKDLKSEKLNKVYKNLMFCN